MLAWCLLCVCLCNLGYLYLSPSVSVSLCVSACKCVRARVCVRVVRVRVRVSLPVCPSVCLPSCASMCVCVCLYVRPSLKSSLASIMLYIAGTAHGAPNACSPPWVLIGAGVGTNMHCVRARLCAHACTCCALRPRAFLLFYQLRCACAHGEVCGGNLCCDSRPLAGVLVLGGLPCQVVTVPPLPRLAHVNEADFCLHRLKAPFLRQDGHKECAERFFDLNWFRWGNWKANVGRMAVNNMLSFISLGSGVMVLSLTFAVFHFKIGVLRIQPTRLQY